MRRSVVGVLPTQASFLRLAHVPTTTHKEVIDRKHVGSHPQGQGPPKSIEWRLLLGIIEPESTPCAQDRRNEDRASELHRGVVWHAIAPDVLLVESS